MKDFVSYTKPDYRFNWHHDVLCTKLDDFIAGKIKKLMVFMPPQHGKSELTTRKLPAKLLGDRPDTRVAISSYSSTFAKGFSLAIQRTIDSTEYHRMYPNTYLAQSKVVEIENDGQERRKADEFELVGKRGSLRVTGVDGGSLTGNPVDVHILDDPYASRDDALSPTINNRVWSFYINVVRMRMHNNSQELVVMTRWHDDDVASRLLKEEIGEWEVVIFPAIKEANDNPDDPRKIGEALWPEHLTVDKLAALKKLSQVTFNASYQQNPKAPTDVLVYPRWLRAIEFPDPFSTFLGGDFGYSNDPTAVVELQVVKAARPKVYVREVLYDLGLSNEDIATYLHDNKLAKKRCYWDSEDIKSVQRLQVLKTLAVPAKKGPGSVNFGITELKKCDLYVVGNASPNLEAELNAYSFHVVGKKITNEPIDKHNHLMDALRYAYTNRLLNGKIKV